MLFQSSNKISDLNSDYYSDFDLYPIFKNIFEKIYSSELNSQINDIFVIRVNFTVVESFKSPNGKFADSYGNVMVIDCNYIIPVFTEAFIKNIEKVTNDKLFLEDILKLIEPVNQIDIRHYVLEVDAVLKDKVKSYSSNGENFKNQYIMHSENFNMNLTVTTPLLKSLNNFKFVDYFLKSTLLTIVFFMVLLSVMLIYSLMVSDIDERTYEMAMIRALGLKSKSIVYIILIQSFIFLIPGICAGVCISLIANVLIRTIVFSYTISYTTYFIGTVTLILGILVGFWMPIISNLLTIQKALGKKIRDSLDVFHVGANEVYAKIVKFEDFGLSLFEFALGLTLTSIGIITYYFVPASFLFQKYELFFFAINLILVLMIIGLGFVSFLVLPYLQNFCVYLICWIVKSDRKLRSLILKNMNYSHIKRNSKTAILFTICLSFLIFGGSSLLLTGNLILGTIKNIAGCDILVFNPIKSYRLPETKLREYLNKEQMYGSSNIISYSFLGKDLKGFLMQFNNTYFSNTLKTGGGYPFVKPLIYPIEENYLSSTLVDYYIPKYLQSGINYPKVEGKDDVVWSLYSNEGTSDQSQNIDKFNITSRNLTRSVKALDIKIDTTQQIKLITAEGMKTALSITGGDTIKLDTSSYFKYFQFYSWRCLIRGLPKKFPGFLFSSYPQVQYAPTAAISFDQAIDISFSVLNRTKIDQKYREMFNNYFNCRDRCSQSNLQSCTSSCNTTAYSKDRLFIKVSDGTSNEDREYISNNLRGVVGDSTTLVLNLRTIEDNILTVLSILQIFTILIGCIALCISFFMLLISISSSVRENLWEFGVLRAIGLKKGQIIRIYLYESLAVTVSACIMGLIIGFILALTISLQFNIFLELPFFVEFPYILVSIMIGLALIITIFGTIIPIREVNKKSISAVLKG